MLWLWLLTALKWIFRLLIPDPYRNVRNRRIDRSRSCTACGNHGGRLVFRMMPEAETPQPRPFVVFVCSTCGFSEGFAPIGVPKHPMAELDLEAEYQQIYGNRA